MTISRTAPLDHLLSAKKARVIKTHDKPSAQDAAIRGSAVRMYRQLWGCAAIALVLSAAAEAVAQAPLPIYTDHLVNGFEDWSWATHDLNNTSPVHSGNNSISVSATAWQALSFYHSAFNTAPYASLSFWGHGGSAGGQVLQAYVQVNGVDQPAMLLSALAANTWRQFNVPLSSLNADGQSNVTRFYLQLTGNGETNTFYVDDIQLAAKPAPAVVHLAVNAAHTIRPVDARWFGINTAIYDWYFDQPETVSLLREMGTLVLRFPGGSMSDSFHWRSNYIVGSTWQGWPTWFTNFAHVATNVGAQAIITANYGTGTPAEAADWVRFSNLTNHYGFKYWEIGNENYGTWEMDSNAYPHDAYTYATRAADYLRQMKAADSSLKIGVVVTPGEDSSDNGYRSHPVLNPRTGQTHYGWTPVLLTTLRSLGVTPDFVIHHRYPEYTDQESDPLLLQSSSAWAGDAADLRQQLSDYLGPAGAGIELFCTENNSNAGSQGKQSVSLVNGLYYADSLGQLMQTEFKSFVWWDLRNGTDTSGSMDSTLYGWRLYGDIGMIGAATNRYPPFYAAKLMQYFARPGDTILEASSDYLLASVYAAQRPNGMVSLLVLNKDTATNFNAQVALAGFAPDPTATRRSYGIPQDNAARSGLGSPDIAEDTFSSVSANFSLDVPRLSLTLLTFVPARLSVQPALQTVVVGDTTAYTVNVAALSGLSNMVVLSVTGLPPGVSASFTPPSVNSPGCATLTVTTFDTTPTGTYPLTILGTGDGLTNTAAATLVVRPWVVAWGDDSFNQVVTPPAATNVVAVAAGAYHNLALRVDGSVFAWGDDWNGQCDLPPGLTNVVAIAAGGYHSLALRADGTVLAWGDDSSGQTDVPVNATNIVAIAAGNWHSLALRTDGTILAWGDDSWGQIDVPANATNIVAMAAGGQHNLALKSDSTVAAWGGNTDPFGNYSGQVDVPLGLKQVLAVAAGGYHSLALGSEGIVVAWGANWLGQTTVPGGLSNAVSVAAGQAHSLALKDDGSLITWGDNSYGQGVVLSNLTGVVAIGAGSSHSLALIGLRPPRPLLGNPVHNGAAFSLSVPTVRGKTYFLQYKNSLSDTGWLSVSVIAGDGGVRTLADPTAGAAHRFYRVRQQ